MFPAGSARDDRSLHPVCPRLEVLGASGSVSNAETPSLCTHSVTMGVKMPLGLCRRTRRATGGAECIPPS
jgi:hypothetical protein